MISADISILPCSKHSQQIIGIALEEETILETNEKALQGVETQLTPRAQLLTSNRI